MVFAREFTGGSPIAIGGGRKLVAYLRVDNKEFESCCERSKSTCSISPLRVSNSIADPRATERRCLILIHKGHRRTHSLLVGTESKVLQGYCRCEIAERETEGALQRGPMRTGCTDRHVALDEDVHATMACQPPSSPIRRRRVARPRCRVRGCEVTYSRGRYGGRVAGTEDETRMTSSWRRATAAVVTASMAIG